MRERESERERERESERKTETEMETRQRHIIRHIHTCREDMPTASTTANASRPHHQNTISSSHSLTNTLSLTQRASEKKRERESV